MWRPFAVRPTGAGDPQAIILPRLAGRRACSGASQDEEVLDVNALSSIRDLPTPLHPAGSATSRFSVAAAEMEMNDLLRRTPTSPAVIPSAVEQVVVLDLGRVPPLMILQTKLSSASRSRRYSIFSRRSPLLDLLAPTAVASRAAQVHIACACSRA